MSTHNDSRGNAPGVIHSIQRKLVV